MKPRTHQAGERLDFTAFWSDLGAPVLIVVVLGIHLFLGYRFIQAAAATYDEPVHLAAGYSYWVTGRYRLNIRDHPPLAEMWASIPLLWMRPHLFLSHPDWISGRLYHYSDYFLYHNHVPADTLLRSARLFAFVTWTLLLVFAVLSWARRVAGTAGMVAAASIYAFSPAFISNLALVTTDGGSTVLFFLTFWLLSHPRFFSEWKRPVLAGLCMGGAYAAKFNMILLGPLALAVAACEWKFLGLSGRMAAGDGKDRPISKSCMIAPALFLGCGFLALAAAYRFGQWGLYCEGLSATLRRLDQGRSTFFFGRHSVEGFLLYFPAALAIKTPLALWGLAVIGIAALYAFAKPSPSPLPQAGEGFRITSSNNEKYRERLWLCVPPVLYMVAALHSKVQIGYRHVLPVVPFMIVWAACGAAWLWECRKPWARMGVIGLMAWLAGSVARVHPYYLAYFNEAVGGPCRGYRYLIDSNLDWGQDMQGLGEAVAELGNPPIYLSYFGMADPAAYDLHYLPVGIVSNVERHGDVADPSVSGRVLLAVSATNLQGTYYQDKTLFDWLKDKTPLRVIGYSIFLYDLTADADGRRHLARVLELAGHPGAARSLLIKWDAGKGGH